MNVRVGLKGASMVLTPGIFSSESEPVVVDIGDFGGEGGNRSGGNSNEESCAIMISERSG